MFNKRLLNFPIFVKWLQTANAFLTVQSTKQHFVGRVDEPTIESYIK